MQTDERTLFLQTVGKFIAQHVADKTRPLESRIAVLEQRIAALEASGIKYLGTYQRAAEYRRGDVVTHEGGMWVATCAVPTMEVPGKSVCWQLSVKSRAKDAA